jgi:3-phenylpropionate/trans-cinnamate dioxygenase ferredoxin reductase subunit
MTRSHTLVVNGTPVVAKSGMTVTDAALRGGIAIPTDCASGQCETCRVRVIAGSVEDAGTGDGCSVLACQARISGDAEIQFDDIPRPSRIRGSVSSIKPLTQDILEVRVDLDEPLAWFPGQYVKLAFRGYPSRDYSPTDPVLEPVDPSRLVFHIKVFQNGVVSSSLWHAIRPGHRLIVEGPFGSAFYRPGPTRLVLVGTSTGWAPLWAIARAARLNEPDRPMAVVVGARRLQNLYMRDALTWLRETGVRDLVLSCSEITTSKGPDVRTGRTTDFLGTITSADTIYAAGAPGMVQAVTRMAAAAGAQCYADPFTMSTTGRSFLGRLREVFETSDPDRLRPSPGRVSQAARSASGPERLRASRETGRSRGLTAGFARWLQDR